MREFSELEKEIISKILKSKYYMDEGAVIFENILTELSYGDEVDILWDIKNGKISNIYLHNSEIKGIDSRYRKQLLNFITLVNLFKRLDENGDLIILKIEPHKDGLNGLTKRSDKFDGLKISIPDGIVQLFDKFSNSIIVPTTSIIYLYNNKFLSKEERRHKSMVRIAIGAIGVSIIMGVIGLFK